jgi:hypothetical protein
MGLYSDDEAAQMDMIEERWKHIKKEYTDTKKLGETEVASG